MQIVKRIKVMHLSDVGLQRSDKVLQRFDVLLEVGVLAKQLGTFRREAVHHLGVRGETEAN